jgi:hypothetical protein
MGWWDEDGLTIGDEPIDRLAHALEAIRQEYHDELGREPTHAEVARFTEIALRTVLDAASDNARIEPTVKIRAKPMKKQRINVGDVFVIRLKKCHYGRIIQQSSLTQVEFYRQTSDHPLPVRMVDTSRQNVKHHKWVLWRLVFEGFRWKLIGNVPIPKDYDFPDYLQGDGPTTFGVRGFDGRTPFAVTPASIRKLGLEPMVAFQPDVYETNLEAGNKDPWPEMLDCLRDKAVRKRRPKS